MFRGYFNLRGPNDRIDIDIEQYQEIERCKKDPIYFIEKYIKINHIDFGMNDFILRNYQKQYIRNLATRNKFMSIWARQSGNSVTHLAYVLWSAIFNYDRKIGIIDHSVDCNIENVKRIIDMLTTLPLWIQPVIEKCSNKCVRFTNGSKICRYNKDVRGQTLDTLLILSASYIMANDIDGCVKYILDNGNIEVILSTTGLGFKNNYLLSVWNDYDFYKVKYGYTRFIKDPEMFKELQVKNLGINRFNSEFAIEEHEQKIEQIIDTSTYK